MLFAGARCLEVHDHRDALVHIGDIHGAAGFQAHLVAPVAQFGEQRQAVGLGQRFPAGHRDVARGEAVHLLEDRVQGPFFAALEGVLGVAPDTALRAAGEAHEYGGHAHAAGFPLQGMEDFGNAQFHGGRSKR